MGQIIDLGKLRFQFQGDYLSGTTYEYNDVVKYGGNVYVYTNPVSASGNVPTNTAYWALMVQGFSFSGVYDSGVTYSAPGTGVTYGGKVYVLIAPAPLGTAPTNATYWSLLADGIQWEGTYDNVKLYQKNDVVKYGNGALYIAKSDTVGNVPTNGTYWDKFVDGVSYNTIYNNGTQYYPNDLVAYGANIYICTASSLGNLPTNTSFWTLFNSGLSFKNAWATATAYLLNDIVVYGGQTFICTSAHTSGTFDIDLSTKWTRFSGGIRWRGTWATATSYLVNDIVFDGTSSTYIVLLDHTSSGSINTDIGAAKLQVFAQGAAGGTPAVSNSTKTKFLSNDGVTSKWVSNYPFTQYIDLSV